jgi:hypothetical protein
MSACRLGQILKELDHSHLDNSVRNEGSKGFNFLFSQSTFLSLTYNYILKHFYQWTVNRDSIRKKEINRQINKQINAWINERMAE